MPFKQVFANIFHAMFAYLKIVVCFDKTLHYTALPETINNLDFLFSNLTISIQKSSETNHLSFERPNTEILESGI